MGGCVIAVGVNERPWSILCTRNEARRTCMLYLLAR